MYNWSLSALHFVECGPSCLKVTFNKVTFIAAWALVAVFQGSSVLSLSAGSSF